MAASDAGIATLANFHKLRRLALFHPGPAFTGVGLSKLADLPDFTSLTRLTLDGILMPEADVKTLTAELQGVQVKWTAPSEAYLKRIQAIFPEQ